MRIDANWGDVWEELTVEQQGRCIQLQSAMNASWTEPVSFELRKRGIKAFHDDSSRGVAIVLVGFPGSGKTTVNSALEERYGAKRLRVKQVAREAGIETEGARTRGALIEGADQAFVDECVSLAGKGELLVLDGFPRSVEQALVLLEAGIKPLVFHMFFPLEEEVRSSILRQAHRDAEKGAVEKGVVVSFDHYLNKIERAVEQDQAALNFLQACHIPVFSISSMLAIEEMVFAASMISGLFFDGARIWKPRGSSEQLT